MRPELLSSPIACLALAWAGVALGAEGEPAFFERTAIFPANSKHNHASCVVELKDGSLLAAWYAGSGERTADDVVIEGSRLAKGKTAWGPKFLMADTPGYPDCNPALFAAPDGSLWLFWPTILDHRWEGALLKYARSEQPTGEPAALKWSGSGVLHVTPRNFAPAVEQAIAALSDEEKSKYRKGWTRPSDWRPTCFISGSAGCRGCIRSCFPPGAGSCRFIPTRSIARSWRSPTIGARPGPPAGP